jgi:Ca-activated chloride channel homolog
MDTPSSITIEYTPVRSVLLQGYDQTLDVIVRLKGPKKPEYHERLGVNLALVLDRSGSMQGKPLAEAKKCIEFVLNRLEAKDQVALVAYDDKVDIVYPSTSAAQKKSIVKALENIEARNSTDLFAGWLAGKSQADDLKKKYDINRVILLSDGQLNSGITDPNQIRQACSDAYEYGVTTSTYGIGKYFNEHVMTIMADAGKGNAYYGETAKDLMEPFTQELDLLAYLYAQNVRVKVTVPNGVSFTCMNHYTQNKDGYFLVPDLPFEAENWLGLRLTIPKDLDPNIASLIEVEVQIDCLDNSKGNSKDVRQIAILPMLDSINATAFEVISKVIEVEKYFAELQVAQWQKEAADYAQKGDWEQVERLITRMEQMELDEWGQEQLQEMRKLLDSKDQALFMKELVYASQSSTRSSKAGLMDYSANPASQEQRQEEESSRFSFLRRKSRKGKSAYVK